VFQIQGSSNPRIISFRSVISRRGIAGTQADVLIEIKPIRKISPGSKKFFLYQTALCFRCNPFRLLFLIFRRQFYYRMRQIDARNREFAEIPEITMVSDKHALRVTSTCSPVGPPLISGERMQFKLPSYWFESLGLISRGFPWGWPEISKCFRQFGVPSKRFGATLSHLLSRSLASWILPMSTAPAGSRRSVISHKAVYGLRSQVKVIGPNFIFCIRCF
jgi:hypothetical protein